jgi:hypothetical protein
VVEFRGVQWFSGESFSGEEEGREGVEEDVGVVEEVRSISKLDCEGWEGRARKGMKMTGMKGWCLGMGKGFGDGGLGYKV